MTRPNTLSWTVVELVVMIQTHLYYSTRFTSPKDVGHIYSSRRNESFSFGKLYPYVVISLSWQTLYSRAIQIMSQIGTILMELRTEVQKQHISSLKAENWRSSFCILQDMANPCMNVPAVILEGWTEHPMYHRNHCHNISTPVTILSMGRFLSMQKKIWTTGPQSLTRGYYSRIYMV